VSQLQYGFERGQVGDKSLEFRWSIADGFQGLDSNGDCRDGLGDGNGARGSREGVHDIDANCEEGGWIS